MTAYVVSVVQSKGGVGKSTLAAQLAVACLGRGYRIAIVDVDRQGSLVAWRASRERVAAQVGGELDVEASSAWRLPYVLQRLGRDQDLIVIDGPSGRGSDFQAITKESDLLLIPCQPTGLDLWATRSLLADCRDLAGKALVVLNRMPPRGKAAALIRQELRSCPGRWRASLSAIVRPMS